MHVATRRGRTCCAFGGRTDRAGRHGSSGGRSAHVEKKHRLTVTQRIKRVGAARGARSGKSGQSNHFAGYKKHTAVGFLRVDGRFRPIPLLSMTRPANVADVDMIEHLVGSLRRNLADIWPVRIVIGDKGYISAEKSKRLREQWQIAMVMHPKSNMNRPRQTDETGCPICPAGERLVWEDYDPHDAVLIYRGNAQACAGCALRATCPKQFEYDAGANEIFFGMIPHHSNLSLELLRVFRPRVEQGFNTAKNRYRLKDFFLNSLCLAQTLCTMCDILDTLEFLAQQRPRKGRQTRSALLRDINAPELWD